MKASRKQRRRRRLAVSLLGIAGGLGGTVGVACFPDVRFADGGFDASVGDARRDGDASRSEALDADAGSPLDSGRDAPPDTALGPIDAAADADAAVVGGHARLAMGEGHACVIRGAERKLICWGANSRYQLGRNTSGGSVNVLPDAVMLNLSALTDVIEVAAAGKRTCAITADHAVRCWGSTEGGGLGNGVTAESGELPGDPLAVAGAGTISGAVATSLVLSQGRNCAVLSSGELVCWGVGDGLGPALRARPERVSGPDAGVSTLAIGQIDGFFGGQNCAIPLGATSRVLCWGTNHAGACGVQSRVPCNDDAGTECVATPSEVPGVSPALGLSANAYVSCAVFGADRKVACWGANVEYGQLGSLPGPFIASGGQAPGAILVDGGAQLSGVAQISVGYRHTCAIVGVDRHVVCWGAATAGRLGSNETSDSAAIFRDTPQTVVDVAGSPLAGVDYVVASIESGCALKTDGGVWCWGDNSEGQLGVPSATTPQSNYAIAVTLP